MFKQTLLQLSHSLKYDLYKVLDDYSFVLWLVLGVISGIALISGFIYCIVNQNWSDAFLIAAFFFIVHIMPKYLDKINKS